MKTALTNKIISAGLLGEHPQYILTGKPVDNSNVTIYLLNAITEDRGEHYSLWNVEITDNGNNLRMTPYKGEDYEDLINELGEDFLEHVYDD
jgi:hypothetical protein